MNGGPFRAPQSNEGGMINNRQASSVPPRQPEEPRTAAVEQPQPATVSHRAPVRHAPAKKEKKSKKNLFLIILAVIVFGAAILAIGLFVPPRGSSISSAIDGGKYQAVFFTNGQVYFGKLTQVNEGYFKLSGVFYLQAKDEAAETDKLQQTTDSSSNDVQLIKLGNEIHGPQDEMVISKDQVLFFENLKAEGKVSTSIEQYNKTNAK